MLVGAMPSQSQGYTPCSDVEITEVDESRWKQILHTISPR
ncbi:MAG: hypothetical protein J07HQW1_01467 [Haloquadratum walsbyi J07HQW1]|uniref:Uncharacterized protein n=1 Tax=Haloquadratum walsbyi J07HQW1 TaxID=1238424 RepID=U1N4W9_9EURY|nr:MAG: hypothetical protein J07HQW1_01467 [Haloquadratum walsbyi J07HQW1]